MKKIQEINDFLDFVFVTLPVLKDMGFAVQPSMVLSENNSSLTPSSYPQCGHTITLIFQKLFKYADNGLQFSSIRTSVNCVSDHLSFKFI